MTTTVYRKMANGQRMKCCYCDEPIQCYEEYVSQRGKQLHLYCALDSNAQTPCMDCFLVTPCDCDTAENALRKAQSMFPYFTIDWRGMCLLSGDLAITLQPPSDVDPMWQWELVREGDYWLVPRTTDLNEIKDALLEELGQSE
jgi:hypothetical protein